MKKTQREAKPIEKLQESAKKKVQHAHGGNQKQPTIQAQRRHQSR
jgi:hypothetical protein